VILDLRLAVIETFSANVLGVENRRSSLGIGFVEFWNFYQIDYCSAHPKAPAHCANVSRGKMNHRHQEGRSHPYALPIPQARDCRLVYRSTLNSSEIAAQ
jgi:hypothetical protein